MKKISFLFILLVGVLSCETEKLEPNYLISIYGSPECKYTLGFIEACQDSNYHFKYFNMTEVVHNDSMWKIIDTYDLLGSDSTLLLPVVVLELEFETYAFESPEIEEVSYFID